MTAMTAPPHPIEGWLLKTTVRDAAEFLARRRPTREQADRLAVEELCGWDRPDMQRILEYYRERGTGT